MSYQAYLSDACDTKNAVNLEIFDPSPLLLSISQS